MEGNQGGITLNFGGRNNYTFTKIEGEITVNSFKNNNYIDEFWGKRTSEQIGVSSISCIVGANGVGKTSILRSLSLKPDNSNKTVYVFEDNLQNIYCLNTSEFKVNFQNATIKGREDISFFNIDTQFYSPNLDYDLKSIPSGIQATNFHDSTLQNYFLDNVQRHLNLLSNEKVKSELKMHFIDFPVYNHLVLDINKFQKSDFRNVHSKSILGDKGIRLENEINDLIRKTEVKKQLSIQIKEIKGVLARSNTIYDVLVKFWSNDNSNLIHKEDSLIKNIEVTLVSFLMLNDFYAIDGDSEIIPKNVDFHSNSFEVILNYFLRKYAYQTSSRVSKELDVEGSLNLENIDNLILKLKKEIGSVSIKTDEKDKDILLVLNTITLYRDFYNTVKNLYDKYGENEKISISVDENGVKEFNKFNKIYKSLIDEVGTNDLNRILNIYPSKRLSTGEKAMLNLYSNIYEYINRYKTQSYHYSRNLLLLLDEPDQGFHPLWTKKLINALKTNLPILFSENRIIKNIQLVMTTHSPLVLSDFPNEYVVHLKKNLENNRVSVLNENTLTFGANIHKLLANDFFMENGFIGEFAKQKIEEIQAYCTYFSNYKELQEINENELDAGNQLEKFKRSFLLSKSKFLEEENNYH